MRFKKGPFGYLKLGIIFMIFGIIPTVLIALVGAPLLIGGTLTGGLTGLGVTTVLLIIIAFVIQGWFVYWFFTNNKFGK